MSEDLDARRRRAVYRASHRGTKEMDFLLGRYAKANLTEMSETELSAFEKFLALPDPDLQSWIMDGVRPSDEAFANYANKLRHFHGLN